MPIGRPIVNTQIHVLGPLLQPVPVGVAGELYVGGAGVGRGYLGDPARTAAAFVPDPFGAECGAPGARLYRTGDLARRLADGSLEFLGRIDHQVKIRGHRIELGEIETVLCLHPGVAGAVAIAHRPGDGPAQLVAYVALRGEGAAGAPPAGPTDLRAYLQARLPPYMVPGQVIVLEALPLSPNGKVDRRQLPAPEAVRPQADAPAEPPSGAVEEAIARIWCDVLGVAGVGALDNFFDLGGHSLLLVQVHGRLQELLERDVPIVELFRRPTVRALAGLADGPERPPPARAGYERGSRRIERKERPGAAARRGRTRKA
jgi:hypothetical protein